MVLLTPHDMFLFTIATVMISISILIYDCLPACQLHYFTLLLISFFFIIVEQLISTFAYKCSYCFYISILSHLNDLLFG